MVGDMISRIREEKKVTKSELARLTNINVGHISHLENEERNPSHRALKTICRALGVPYQPLMYTYDKVFTDEQMESKMYEHISYNQVPAVSSVDSFIEIPADFPSTCLALKVNDNSMEPKIQEGCYVFIEFNTPLENKDIVLVDYNGKVMIRRYVIKKDGFVLRADNKEFEDIILSKDDKYNFIGKILGTNTGLIF